MGTGKNDMVETRLSAHLSERFIRFIDPLTDLTADDDKPTCEHKGCDREAQYVIGGKLPNLIWQGMFACMDHAKRFSHRTGVRLPLLRGQSLWLEPPGPGNQEKI